MRTTLTLEDDLDSRLKKLARSTGKSFKEVVNSAIRKGLSLGDAPVGDQDPFRVVPKACGFRAGIDPTKLNQLYDDLEIEDLRQETTFEVHEP
jgi:hypothetical protein